MGGGAGAYWVGGTGVNEFFYYESKFKIYKKKFFTRNLNLKEKKNFFSFSFVVFFSGRGGGGG